MTGAAVLTPKLTPEQEGLMEIGIHLGLSLLLILEMNLTV